MSEIYVGHVCDINVWKTPDHSITINIFHISVGVRRQIEEYM